MVTKGSHVLIGVHPFLVLDGTESPRGYVTLEHLKSGRVGNYRAVQTRPLPEADLKDWDALMLAQAMARQDAAEWRQDAADALATAWVESHS